MSGSLRSGSTNTALLRTAATVVPDDVAADLFAGTAVLPYFDPDLDRDPLPPPVVELRNAVHAADALLICTPEYAGALPGAFKNLLEWLIGDDQPRSISGKRVGIVNVSAAPTGARDAHQSLRTVLRYAGADVITDVEIPIERAMIGDDGRVDDRTVRQQVTSALAALLGS
jgi:NAD(P)H-dependent FMN reductase